MFALIIPVLLMAISFYLAYLLFERVVSTNAVKMLASVGAAVVSIFFLLALASSHSNFGPMQFALMVVFLPAIAAYLIAKYNDFEFRPEESNTASAYSQTAAADRPLNVGFEPMAPASNQDIAAEELDFALAEPSADIKAEELEEAQGEDVANLEEALAIGRERDGQRDD